MAPCNVAIQGAATPKHGVRTGTSQRSHWKRQENHTIYRCSNTARGYRGAHRFAFAGCTLGALFCRRRLLGGGHHLGRKRQYEVGSHGSTRITSVHYGALWSVWGVRKPRGVVGEPGCITQTPTKTPPSSCPPPHTHTHDAHTLKKLSMRLWAPARKQGVEVMKMVVKAARPHS